MAFILIVTLPFYLLTHPIEAFVMMNENDIISIERFQGEYSFYGGDGAAIDISCEYVENEIPLFIQWDKRWNLYPYGNLVMILIRISMNNALDYRISPIIFLRGQKQLE